MPDNHVTEGQFVEYIQEAATQMNKIDDKINQVEKIIAFNFKTNVATYADLPTIGNEVNDGYGVTADGLVYVWNGEAFPPDGDGIDLNLRPIGKVQEGDPMAVAGGEVYSRFNPFIKTSILIPFILQPGEVSPLGVPNTSVNWLRTDPIPCVGEQDVYVIGLGVSNDPFGGLSSKRIFFYNGSSFINFIAQSPLSSSIEFTTPENCDNYVIQVEAFGGAGSDIPNSPFWNSLKISTKPISDGYIVAEQIKGNILTDQITGIEEEISELKTGMLQGHYAPPTTLGSDGSVYLNTSNGIIYEKINSKWIQKNPLAGQLRLDDYPTEFTYRPFEIYRNTSNGVYIPEVSDISSLVIDEILEMTPYYVDPVNGNNSNDGLSEKKAFLTVVAAISAGASLIYLMDGIYGRSQGILNVSVDKNMAFIAYKNAIQTSWDDSTIFTWTQDENVYYTTRSATKCVFDTNRYISEKDGFFTFSQVSTLELCKSTVDSFFISGSLVYVNDGTSLPPEFNIKIALQMGACQFSLASDIDFIYLEGIISYVQNGAGGISVSNSASQQYDGRAILKRCSSYSNRLGNSFSINNVKEAFVQDCGGSKPLRDALNYHTSLLNSGYQVMNAVEINGWSKNTGWETSETSANGSTAHEGMNIIRFGGIFDTSRGSTVVDVNFGVKSLNHNVVALNSLLALTAEFQVQDGTMWLRDCYAAGGDNSTKSDGLLPNVVYYDKDCKLIGTKIGNVVEI